MAAPVYPFTAFNFAVEINRGEDGAPLVNAAFSECDGLEMSMDVKTIREGGANDRQIRLNGPVNYGQLTLKRGMTESFDLWKWFRDSVDDPRLRADADVVLLCRRRQRRARALSARPLRAGEDQGACAQREGRTDRDRGAADRLRNPGVRTSQALTREWS